mmetsp:Transcript_67700/g.141144  ORF Transcript_67700/g.141144 Transcript_67700/m.141144 type:complete len:127 (+) Transcript_67700:602-982(+)
MTMKKVHVDGTIPHGSPSGHSRCWMRRRTFSRNGQKKKRDALIGRTVGFSDFMGTTKREAGNQGPAQTDKRAQMLQESALHPFRVVQGGKGRNPQLSLEPTVIEETHDEGVDPCEVENEVPYALAC